MHWTTVEYVTDTVAVAAVSSPWWMPTSQAQIHAELQIALQIMGLIYLMLQIVSKVHAWRKGRNS